jgi:predicted ATPase
MTSYDRLQKEIERGREIRFHHGPEPAWRHTAWRLRNYGLDPTEWPEYAEQIWHEHVVGRFADAVESDAEYCDPAQPMRHASNIIWDLTRDKLLAGDFNWFDSTDATWISENPAHSLAAIADVCDTFIRQSSSVHARGESPGIYYSPASDDSLGNQVKRLLAANVATARAASWVARADSGDGISRNGKQCLIDAVRCYTAYVLADGQNRSAQPSDFEVEFPSTIGGAAGSLCRDTWRRNSVRYLLNALYLHWAEITLDHSVFSALRVAMSMTEYGVRWLLGQPFSTCDQCATTVLFVVQSGGHESGSFANLLVQRHSDGESPEYPRQAWASELFPDPVWLGLTVVGADWLRAFRVASEVAAAHKDDLGCCSWRLVFEPQSDRAHGRDSRRSSHQRFAVLSGNSASAAACCALMAICKKQPLERDIVITAAVQQDGKLGDVGGKVAKLLGMPLEHSDPPDCLELQRIENTLEVLRPYIRSVLVTRKTLWLDQAARRHSIQIRRVETITEALGLLAGRLRPPCNVPVLRSSFVGREREMAELAELFSDAQSMTQLVTIAGPPGTGKTRLTLETGRRLIQRFPGGCWFADLSETRTSAGISEAVAASFGVPLPGGIPPEEGVSRFLEFREPLLLILDNFEQVATHAGSTIGLWRQRAPQVSFLVTSRALLGLDGEREFFLNPLLLPPADRLPKLSAGEIATYDCVQLFLDRAQQVRTGFALSDENAQSVAQICVRLDGIPLAIELAAARIRILQPSQLLTRLEQSPQLLRTTRRDVARRHETLLAAIEWSYELLEPYEKDVFLRVSIFTGGFYLDAAESILAASNLREMPPLVGVIQSLCEKSLLKVTDTDYGPRFRMLLSVRDYAQTKWRSVACEEEQSALWDRTVEHFLGYAEAWNERMFGATCREALDRLSIEMDNLLAVHTRTSQRDELEVAARLLLAIDDTISTRGPFEDHVPRLQTTLERSFLLTSESCARLKLAYADALKMASRWDDSIVIANELIRETPASNRWLHGASLVVCSHAFREKGLYRDALRSLCEAEIKLRPADTKTMKWYVRCLRELSHVSFDLGENRDGVTYGEQGEAAARTGGLLLLLPGVVNARGLNHLEMLEFELAEHCFSEAAVVAKCLGSIFDCSYPLGSQGWALERRGRFAEAIACHTESASIDRDCGRLRGVAASLMNRGYAKRQLLRPKDAINDFRESAEFCRRIGFNPGLAECLSKHALASLDIDDFASAEVFLSEAERLHASGRLWGYGLTQWVRGRRQRALGSPAEAIVVLKDAADGYRTQRSLDDAANVSVDWGAALLACDESQEARTVLLDAVRFYEGLGIRSAGSFEGTVLLAKVEQKLGHPSASADWARRAVALADALKLTSDHEATWFTRLLHEVT